MFTALTMMEEREGRQNRKKQEAVKVREERCGINGAGDHILTFRFFSKIEPFHIDCSQGEMFLPFIFNMNQFATSLTKRSLTCCLDSLQICHFWTFFFFFLQPAKFECFLFNEFGHCKTEMGAFSSWGLML